MRLPLALTLLPSLFRSFLLSLTHLFPNTHPFHAQHLFKLFHGQCIVIFGDKSAFYTLSLSISCLHFPRPLSLLSICLCPNASNSGCLIGFQRPAAAPQNKLGSQRARHHKSSEPVVYKTAETLLYSVLRMHTHTHTQQRLKNASYKAPTADLLLTKGEEKNIIKN